MKSLIRNSWRFSRFAALRGAPLTVLIFALIAGVIPAPMSEVCAGGGTDASCTHGCCTGGATMSCCPPASHESRRKDKPASLTKAADVAPLIVGGNCACPTTTQVTYLHERNRDSISRDVFATTPNLSDHAGGHAPLAQVPRAPPLS